jgi:hypothetical protein
MIFCHHDSSLHIAQAATSSHIFDGSVLDVDNLFHIILKIIKQPTK